MLWHYLRGVLNHVAKDTNKNTYQSCHQCSDKGKITRPCEEWSVYLCQSHKTELHNYYIMLWYGGVINWLKKMHLRIGEFLMVNARINFKYHRTATILTKLNKVKKKKPTLPIHVDILLA